MTESASTPAVDKAALRRDLEATHAAYRELIGQLPDGKWDATSGNSAFTCGQLAWHLASGLEFSAELIDSARKGKQTTVPAFLMWLGNKVNIVRIRRGARNATRDSVLADYDEHLARLLRLLDEVSDAEFGIVKTNYAITRSVREMFEIPIEHLAEHGPEIRSAP